MKNDVDLRGRTTPDGTWEVGVLGGVVSSFLMRSPEVEGDEGVVPRVVLNHGYRRRSPKVTLVKNTDVERVGSRAYHVRGKGERFSLDHSYPTSPEQSNTRRGSLQDYTDGRRSLGWNLVLVPVGEVGPPPRLGLRLVSSGPVTRDSSPKRQA